MRLDEIFANSGFTHKIRDSINSADWSDQQFDKNKAFVLAAFSKLAYLHIPEFELRTKIGLNLIPCVTHRELAFEGRTIDVVETIREDDIGEAFVVETRYTVILTLALPNVTIISVRGTRLFNFSDWMINAAAKMKKGLDSDNPSHGFHLGFFKAITRAIPMLTHELLKRNILNHKNRVPIVVTGHSLGGALGAILFSKGSFDLRSHSSISHFHIYDAYTFGMPRYCNIAALHERKIPHHVVNQNDLVPHLPPTWMGYEDCPLRFVLNGIGSPYIASGDTIPALRLWPPQNIQQGLAEHQIETYLRRLASA